MTQHLPNVPPRRFGRRSLLGGGAALGLAGCTTAPEADLALIYNRAAQHHGIDRNPIVVIPGLLGSRLRDPASGRIVWGAFEGNAADPRTPDGARLIALPIAAGTASRPIAVDGALDRVRIRVAGIPISLRAYGEILATLGVGGYRDEALGLGGEIDYGREHFTCFQFAYDWRLDNVHNARLLMAFLREKRALVQAEYARRFGVRDHPVRFDIVAHSMGGLVARYALLYGEAELPADGSTPEPSWAGAPYIARLIQVGTPNGGSIDALRVLVDGRDFGAPIVPRYGPAILGTFPSLYQLLVRPENRPLEVTGEPGSRPDPFDPGTWRRFGWGLAAPGLDAELAVLIEGVASAEERRRAALALQERLVLRGRAFVRAMDRPVTPRPGSPLMLVAGDAMPTAARMAVDPATGAIRVAQEAPGDGLVLRDSVLRDLRQGMDERGPAVQSPLGFERALFLPQEHLEVVRDPVFRNNLLFWLLEEPRRA
jgi:hypothetical protein